MIDSNLPGFYIKRSKEAGHEHDCTIFLSEYGGDPLPTYTVKHPNPVSVESHNRYAAALYDAYNPEVLFGEVLLIPEWTLPTLSQDEIRRNGGIPPPPQPILPNKFVIQLYNPDQQVVVEHHPSTWNSAQHWEFALPVHTFRQPSASTLDKSQNDPTLSEATPKVEFRWKRESKLTKDLLCILNGRRSPDKGKKHKEPDIPMAFCKNLKEITLYEPNMNRIDLEDPKGFEIALLLSALTIKDVYFQNIKDAFNISEITRTQPVPPHGRSSSAPSLPIPPPHNHQQRPPIPGPATMTRPGPPPTDPRSQWEIDAETIRLRKQVEAEEKSRKQREKEQEKQVRRMVEEEQKAARRRQEEIDAETERLRRVYQAEQKQQRYPGYHPPPAMPPRPGNGLLSPTSGPYGNGSSAYAASTSTFFGGSSNSNQQVKPKRSSFFGLRGGGEGQERTLLKKQSAIF